MTIMLDTDEEAGCTFCAVATLNLLECKQDDGRTVQWLAYRHTMLLDDEESEEEDLLKQETDTVGVNGRCNKIADTCYVFWVGGALDVSGLGT